MSATRTAVIVHGSPVVSRANVGCILRREPRGRAFKALIASDVLRHREKATSGAADIVGNVPVV